VVVVAAVVVDAAVVVVVVAAAVVVVAGPVVVVVVANGEVSSPQALAMRTRASRTAGVARMRVIPPAFVAFEATRRAVPPPGPHRPGARARVGAAYQEVPWDPSKG